MKIRKGDQVRVLAGKDRGKTGAVLKVFPKGERISVEGLNLYKKRVKPKRQGQKGETISVSRPFSVSRVMLVCVSCKRPTRAGYRVEKNQKVRYCKKCKATT